MGGRDQSIPYFTDTRAVDVLNEQGRRLDGRAYEEFRNVFLKTGVISQASGSSYIELGKTKVIVGVYGPRQSDRREAFREKGHISVDMKLASFATRQRGTFRQTPEEREMSALVETALEAVVLAENFPKAVLDVYITVLEAGGSEVPCAITAASLAIASAGVDMKDIVSACSVAKVHGLLLLDPTEEEEYREEAHVILASSGILGEIAQVESRGVWQDNEIKEALELCLGGCAQLDGALRQTLKEAAILEISNGDGND